MVKESVIVSDINQLPLSLTVSDIAKILGIGKANAYDLCNSEGFPSIKIGKRIITPKPAFISWFSNPLKYGKEY
ncbi:MAG: helix-turn-helix domain-containing protein [Clostridiaceae bacterium]|nr:helix-turn-helix domain-containing protein [Clostridiaceae bacterium]